jgi:hypothetical protein
MVLSNFAASLESQAQLLRGKTLASLPANMNLIRSEIDSADRILFYTSKNMGRGLTMQEMHYIQSQEKLREKTTFVLGFYPE